MNASSRGASGDRQRSNGDDEEDPLARDFRPPPSHVRKRPPPPLHTSLREYEEGLAYQAASDQLSYRRRAYMQRGTERKAPQVRSLLGRDDRVCSDLFIVVIRSSKIVFYDFYPLLRCIINPGFTPTHHTTTADFIHLITVSLSRFTPFDAPPMNFLANLLLLIASLPLLFYRAQFMSMQTFYASCRSPCSRRTVPLHLWGIYRIRQRTCTDDPSARLRRIRRPASGVLPLIRTSLAIRRHMLQLANIPLILHPWIFQEFTPAA